MNKTTKLITALMNGEELTAKQIANRFGFASTGSVRRVLSGLRLDKGLAIYMNERKDTKGRVKNKYRLGTPTRRVVAAGYRAAV